MRVSQNWAGGAWGQMAIPRIGHEVIIDFLEGDPDQPIVTGRTYHAVNPPPYELPRHKTRMTLKSSTHKGEGYNELRFEDQKEKEEIFIHAQKDQNNVVNHDETTQVGHDRTEDVGHDESIRIGHDRTESVKHDEKISIGNDQSHQIGRNQKSQIGKDKVVSIGNHKHEEIAADFEQTIGGHLKRRVGGRVELKAGEKVSQQTRVYQIETNERFIVKGPAGAIIIDAGGITLKGKVQIKGGLAITGGSGGGGGYSGAPFSGQPLCKICMSGK
ncbi:type VI secretion system Vgr family protein [Candidatus Vondammii sp. HM_W22]|uniref:type VI secretion system Vgr family protein n=1 Tax=Candidatus Vondammii sp. HM_W22 TaxID=2687299 RepID=UPI00403DAFD6